METRALLGRRVRDLRTRNGLTQERLAEMAGIGVKYLGSIERGKENPTIAVLENLAAAFSLTVHQLLDVEHKLKGRRELKRKIVEILDRCDEEELETILRLARAIRE